MGGIGGMFGLSGGASGTGFAAPQMAPVIGGTNDEQIRQSYGAGNAALGSQQALLNALQGQGGIGNQSQVYGQLQGVVNGTGPNPAQAQLAQATGQNVANQAAMMAGQRGAGANVGLLARQAAQQGAATQQNAIGQAATMQAQQSLGALGQAGQMANTQAGQQIGATTANTQAQQSQQKILQDALAAQNNASVNAYNSVNSGNTALAGKGMDQQGQVIGGMLSGAGQGMAMMAGGGQIAKYAGGGYSLGVDTNMGPQSSFGKFLSGWSGDPATAAAPEPAPQAQPSIEPAQAPLQKGSSDFVRGAMQMAPMMMAARGGNVGSQLKSGGHVPGQAKAAGNSYSNDTVKALLSPGELVVDRETMKDKGKAGEAARFLAAVIAAKKRGKK